MTSFPQAREAMVDCQVRPSDVTRYTVIDAMLTVPREEFVPTGYRGVAYAGGHIPVANGRVVLDPRIAAKMLDEAAIGPNELVLDIGCTYGYFAALIGHMCEVVIATEPDADIANQAASTLAELEADNVIVENKELVDGSPDHGPYDLVIIEGAIEMVPDAIAKQVKEGGRIVAIFMDGVVGQCRVGTKQAGALSWRRAFDATAPLLPGFTQEKAFEF